MGKNTENVLKSLSCRELDVLSCTVNRYSNKETAVLLNVSHRTVETHVRSIFIKTGCLTKEEIVRLLKETGAWNELCERHEKFSKADVSPVKYKNRRKYAYGIAGIFIVLSAFSTFIFQRKEPEASFNIGRQSTERYCLERKNIEDQIEFALKSTDDIVTVILVGQGGAGKTTLAEKYLRKLHASFKYEMNAETENSLKSSFSDLAYQLVKQETHRKDLNFINGISDEEIRYKQLLHFIQERMKDLPGWVLVLDNLEDLKHLKNFCPSDPDIWGRGKMIITTRNEYIKTVTYVGKTSIISVGELEEEEREELFGNISGATQKDRIKEFLKQIPGYPLDVSSAAYYIKNTGISLSDYSAYTQNITDEFVNMNKRFVSESTNYDRTRYGIVTSNFREILGKNKRFASLLSLICLFDSQQISLQVLRKAEGAVVTDGLVSYLKQYSLITNDGDRISIHRSTQNIGLDYLSKEIKPSEKSAILNRLTAVLTPYEHLDSNYDELCTFIPHLKSFLSNLGKFESDGRERRKKEISLLITLGELCRNKEKSTIKALDFLDKALETNKIENCLSDFDIRKILLTAGEACVIASQNDRAADYLKNSFIGQPQGENNRIFRARSYNLMGTVHMRKGNLKEANRNFDMALQTVKNAKLQTAEVKIMQAVSCANKGFCCYLYNINKPQMHDAVDLMRQAVDLVKGNLYMKDESLRKQSVQVLINIKSRLGGIYNSLKEYKKALSLEDEAEELMQSISEQDNASFCNLGLINMEKGHAYLRLNQLKKARELFAAAKTIFDKAMIGDHWIRLRMQETEVLVRLGELEKAYKNCEDVFERGDREKNDYNKLFFNTCHYNAGVIKYKQKDIRTSLKHFRDYAGGMKVFCKQFLSEEQYKGLLREGAFNLIYNENDIKKCFQNALKIFTIVCMDGSEFITDYVRQNFLNVTE